MRWLLLLVAIPAFGYTLGGNITGFTGSSFLVLRLNNTTSRIVPAGAISYKFSTTFTTGQPYAVSVGIQPAGLRCTISKASGVFQAVNITDANITCLPLVSTQLMWTLPTQNTDGSILTDLTGYVIYYGTDPTFTTKVVKFVSAPALSTTITNLTAGNTYYFAISSVSASGGTGPMSNAARLTL